MTDVFMSYSRDDRDLVARVVEALRARGKTVWVDLDDIIPSSKWMSEIRDAIAASDTVIAAISPTSVASPVCQEEVSMAVAMPKRLVPIVVRETPAELVPPALSELSFLFFTPAPGDRTLPEGEFFERVDRLVQVLDTDIQAVHTHSEILRRAQHWEARGRDSAQLLRGRDLEEAELWQAAQTGHNPAVTPAQRQYIVASRRAATRRQRTWFTAATALLVVMALLVAVALVMRRSADAAKQVAIHQRNAAISAEIAGESSSVLTADPQLGLILALRAYNTSHTSQAEEAVRQAVARSAVRALWPGHANLDAGPTIKPISPAAFDPSGPYVVAAKKVDVVQVWDWRTHPAGGGGHVFTLSTRPFSGFQTTKASFVDRGSTVLVQGTVGTYPNTRIALLAWDWRHSKTAKMVKRIPAGSVLSPNAEFVAQRSAGGVLVGRALERGGTTLVHTNGLPVAISNGGRLLATQHTSSALGSGEEPGAVVKIWRIPGGVMLRSSDLAPSFGFDGAAAFSSNGSRLALGGLSVEVLDVRGSEPPRTHHLTLPQGLSPHTDDVNGVGCLAWSPSGALAVGAEDNYVRIWTTASASPIFLSSQIEGWGGVAFSAGGEYLASGDGEDGTVQVWQWESASSPVLPVPASQTLISGNGLHVAVGTLNGWTLLWDWMTGRARTLAPGTPMAFSPDGTKLLVDEIESNKLVIFDVASGREVASMPLPSDSSTAAPNQAQFSSDGTTIALLIGREDFAGQGYGNLAVWDWAAGSPVYWKSWTPYQSALLAYSKTQGITFLSGTSLMRWDGERASAATVLARKVAPALGLGEVLLLPGGRDLLEETGELGQATLVDIKTHSSVPVLTGYSAEGVSTGIFSVDRAANLAVFSGSSGYISAWDMRRADSPVIITSLSTGQPTSVSMDSSGQVLAAASSTGAHIFFCQYCGSFSQVLKLAHQRVVRALTPAEQAAFLGRRRAGPESIESLFQAPLVSEVVSPGPRGPRPAFSGNSPSSQLFEDVPGYLTRVACQVEPEPALGAYAEVACGQTVPKARVPAGVPVVQLHYLAFPSDEALDRSYKTVVAPLAQRTRTETEAACGPSTEALAARAECSFSFSKGPSGQVLEYRGAGAGAKGPAIVWTVKERGLPAMLVTASGPARPGSLKALAKWWDNPSNWVQTG